MYICSECGQVYAEPVSACAICGCTAIKPKVVEPLISPVTITITPEECNSSPRISGGTRAKGIIGFVMALEGIIGSAMYALYALLLVSVIFGYGDAAYELFSYSYGFGYTSGLEFIIIVYLFSLIAQLVIGLVAAALCNSATDAGYVSKMTSAGKILGILTAVISAVAAILLFIALLAL